MLSCEVLGKRLEGPIVHVQSLSQQRTSFFSIINSPQKDKIWDPTCLIKSAHMPLLGDTLEPYFIQLTHFPECSRLLSVLPCLTGSRLLQEQQTAETLKVFSSVQLPCPTQKSFQSRQWKTKVNLHSEVAGQWQKPSEVSGHFSEACAHRPWRTFPCLPGALSYQPIGTLCGCHWEIFPVLSREDSKIFYRKGCLAPQGVFSATLPLPLGS